jgi:hypothetical protein
MITLHAPQAIYTVLFLLGVFIHIARHGQKRTDTYDGGIALLATGITFALLWWGGFYQ